MMKKLTSISAAALLAVCSGSAFAQADAQVASVTPAPIKVEPAPKVKLAPGGAKLMVWQGLEPKGLQVGTLIDNSETFSYTGINKDQNLTGALGQKDRYQLWEGYIEVKKDSMLKFNVTRAVQLVNTLPGASLSINGKSLITMKTEPSYAQNGIAPTTAQSVLVSLSEGYNKISFAFAISGNSDSYQTINLTYGLPGSANVRMITPKSMFYEVDEEDF